MKNKRLITLLLAIVMIFSLVACSSSADKDSGNASSGDGSSADADKPYAGTELRFLDTSPSDVREAYFEEIFDKLYDDTGIRVTYESTPLEDAANKITVMAKSNSLPDMITTQDNWLGQFTASQWIISLDNYLTDDIKASFNATVTNIVYYSCRTVGVR